MRDQVGFSYQPAYLYASYRDTRPLGYHHVILMYTRVRAEYPRICIPWYMSIFLDKFHLTTVYLSQIRSEQVFVAFRSAYLAFVYVLGRAFCMLCISTHVSLFNYIYKHVYRLFTRISQPRESRPRVS